MEIFTLEFWKGVWDDFVDFLTELPALILKELLDFFATLIEALDPPSFLNQSLGDSLGPTMNYIGFAVAQSGLSEAMGLLGAAIGFRLLRKIATLGQW